MAEDDKAGGQFVKPQSGTIQPSTQKPSPYPVMTVATYEQLLTLGRLPVGYSKKDLTGVDD